MARSLRNACGGVTYHVLNRANARLPLFEKPGDYDAFERILDEALEYCPTPLLAYCIMPNHWHLVVRPIADGDLSRFVGWLTLTHTQRWHAHHHTAGHGHLYQGRFKSFPIQEDEHFLTVCRYVERNAVRAGLAKRAEDWKWGSLWCHESCNSKSSKRLAEWPVPRPVDWRETVDAAYTIAEQEAIRRCIVRGSPFGADSWVKETAKRLGLETTLRPRGRPKKGLEKGS